MCEKVRHYDKESIEVCRNCKGTGVAYTVPEFHPYGKEKDPEPFECPVCKGSGRVKKTLNIEITIEPYAGSSSV
jgi:DnaJ-class molecular chaperone